MARSGSFLSVALAFASAFWLGASSVAVSVGGDPSSHSTRARRDLQLDFSPYDELFENFTNTFNKTYTNCSERARRFQQFKANLADMEAHNALYDRGQKSYFMAPNQFSDMSHDEYLQFNKLGKHVLPINMTRMRRSSLDTCYIYSGPRLRSRAPDSVDWRAQGAVTEVQNQGQCGSCWVFSANGAMESDYFLRTGQLINLSEQQVIDCCTRQYCDGCEGGDTTTVYMYASGAGGIVAEEDYPYVGEDDKCQTSRQAGQVSTSKCWVVNQGSEDDLKEAVGTNGAVAVAVSALHSSFMNYAGGVYYSEDCGNTLDDLDHGMLVVGYGTQDGQDYWLVKNSWGPDWGVEGYSYMSRNRDNNCGIATYASFSQTTQA